MLGETNPRDSKPGTIRGDFGRVSGRNIVHASDSPDNGVREAGVVYPRDDRELDLPCESRSHFTHLDGRGTSNHMHLLDGDYAKSPQNEPNFDSLREVARLCGSFVMC